MLLLHEESEDNDGINNKRTPRVFAILYAAVRYQGREGRGKEEKKRRKKESRQETAEGRCLQAGCTI